MSTLYISNTGPTNNAGVWRVSNSANQYQYQYTTFTPGQDVNLDSVSVWSGAAFAGQTIPNNFQVGLYSAGADSSTPGSLLSYLSGPTSPTPGAYNNYTAASGTALASGSQYWLGFTLSSDTGADSNTRVRLGINNGSSITLGSGWTAPNTRYQILDNTAQPNEAGALVYNLYATPSSQAICFIKGTFILTSDGTEKAIEDLHIGDYIVTSSGPLPIKWIAKQTIRRHCVPAEKYAQSVPVRIEAGSLGKNTPKTDLLVSEAHGIHVDRRIVNAAFLVNQLNIYKDNPRLYPEAIHYFHLEFDDEVLIVANGAETCSYRNENNRRNFDNYPEFVSLYVDADATIKSSITNSPRNCPSLPGHKQRVRRSWKAA
jgi:hypothetical protein